MKNLTREKIRESVLSGIDEAMDKVENQYDNVSERASQVAESMKMRAAQTKEKTEKYIHEHPGKSLLMAAGAGAVAAFLTVLIMRRKK